MLACVAVVQVDHLEREIWRKCFARFTSNDVGRATDAITQLPQTAQSGPGPDVFQCK